MVNYYIKVGSGAERNLRSYYGVHVSGSKGLVGKPAYKDSQKYSWDYLNGEWTDLSTRRYKSREITLHCWIEAAATMSVRTTSAETTAVWLMNNFLKAFDTEDLVRLRISFTSEDDIENSLFYLVYLKDSDVKYKWSKGRQIMEFDIDLIEPSPEKIIMERKYLSQEPAVTASYSSVSEFDIDWGDGSTSHDLVGSNKTVTHTYASAGTYYIIVSGVTKDITITVPEGEEEEHEEIER